MAKPWRLLARQTLSEWNKHETPRLGAALAFYLLLSLSPLIVLTVAVTGVFADQSDLLGRLTSQFQDLLGGSAGQALRALLESAHASPGEARGASIASIAVLLAGASGVFTELRAALNTIWDIDPDSEVGLWGIVRERILAFATLVGIGLLLFAALILSAGLSAVSSVLLEAAPLRSFLVRTVDFVISVAGTTAVFSLTFKYIPAATVPWRRAWFGGAVTAMLFTVGKYLIGIYLTTAAVGSAYGAAGSLVVVIVWAYYTAQIFFLGAEITHVLGSPPVPDLALRNEHS